MFKVGNKRITYMAQIEILKNLFMHHLKNTKPATVECYDVADTSNINTSNFQNYLSLT